MDKNTTIENLLRHISELRNDYGFSCDIYHDDLKDQMVVRLSGFHDDLDHIKHFRGDILSNLLLDAINYIKKRKAV